MFKRIMYIGIIIVTIAIVLFIFFTVKAVNTAGSSNQVQRINSTTDR